MPETETSEALSRVLQLKFKKFVVIFSIYLLTKVITYQIFLVSGDFFQRYVTVPFHLILRPLT